MEAMQRVVAVERACASLATATAAQVEREQECDRQRRAQEEEEANKASETGLESDCVVCWSNEAAVALIPCGHVCLCRNCSALSICPMSVERLSVEFVACVWSVFVSYL